MWRRAVCSLPTPFKKTIRWHRQHDKHMKHTSGTWRHMNGTWLAHVWHMAVRLLSLTLIFSLQPYTFEGRYIYNPAPWAAEWFTTFYRSWFVHLRFYSVMVSFNLARQRLCGRLGSDLACVAGRLVPSAFHLRALEYSLAVILLTSSFRICTNWLRRWCFSVWLG